MTDTGGETDTNNDIEALETEHVVKQPREPNGCVRFLQECRYYVNRFLLWKPFYCLASIDGVRENLHFIFYDLSLFEMAYWLFLQILLYTAVVNAINDDGDKSQYVGIGVLAEILYFFTLLTGHRNSFTNLFFGLSLDRTIFFHQYMGRWAIMIGWWHGLGMQLNVSGEGFGSGRGITGLLAQLTTTTMACLAYWWIRRNHYNFFVTCHFWLSVLFCIIASIHGAWFLLIPLICNFVDLCFRYWKLARQDMDLVELTTITKNKNIIKVVFKNTIKFNSGDYVYIVVKAISQEMHPFSIASIQSDNHCKLYIKASGDYTSKFASLINEPRENVNEWLKNFIIYVEDSFGYNQLGIADYTNLYDKYNNLIYIAGGIGVTPMISMFRQLLVNIEHLKTSENLKSITFIWSFRELELFQEFEEHLISNNSNEYKVMDVNVKVLLYLTDREANKDQVSSLYSYMNFGRFNPKNWFEKNTNDAQYAICCCGPDIMIRDVRKECISRQFPVHSEKFYF